MLQWDLNMSSDFSDEWFTYRLFVRNATAEDLTDDKGHIDLEEFGRSTVATYLQSS